MSLISPGNSFIQFSTAAPDADNCFNEIPYCLPISSWEDVYVQFLTVTTDNPPTVVVKIKGTTIDTLSHDLVKQENVGGENHWLAVLSNCCDLDLLLARFNTIYGAYGTWTRDMLTGNFHCSGDIHTFAETVDGTTYHLVCSCYIHITGYGGHDLAWILNYLQTNYPSYGGWAVDGAHADSIICTGDICAFPTDVIPGVTYEILTSTDCEIAIDSYTCTDQDIVDWLNIHASSFGTWSLEITDPMPLHPHIICTGDITSFSEILPCIDYIIDNDGVMTYTNLFYGRLGDTGHAIDYYLTEGECFSFTVTVDETVYTSNCFQYSSKTCFTSRIKYRSNQNVFGFTYYLDSNNDDVNDIATFYNIVRIPAYIRQPEPRSTETQYRLSDGDYKLLSSVMENLWEMITDWVDRDFHRKLFVALGNNEFWLTQDDVSLTRFQKEGEYKIGWDKSPGLNMNSAPATVQLKESPFFNYNSNCQ